MKECDSCEGTGRVYNNNDPTSNMWMECPDCRSGDMIALRVSKLLKDNLKKEAKQKGFPGLSRYVSHILFAREK